MTNDTEWPLTSMSGSKDADVERRLNALQMALDAHLQSTNNPHQTTHLQVGGPDYAAILWTHLSRQLEIYKGYVMALTFLHLTLPVFIVSCIWRWQANSLEGPVLRMAIGLGATLWIALMIVTLAFRRHIAEVQGSMTVLASARK
jgi:hypothetical protein